MSTLCLMSTTPKPTFSGVEMPERFTLVVHPENAGMQSKYVGRCVEFDICVEGGNVEELKERFVRTIWGHVAIARRCGETPFKCIIRKKKAVSASAQAAKATVSIPSYLKAFEGGSGASRQSRTSELELQFA